MNVYVYLFGLVPSAIVGLIVALMEIATMRRVRFTESILLLLV